MQLKVDLNFREREFQQEQEFEEEQALCMQLQEEENLFQKRPLAKIQSLPPNFTYSTPIFENKFNAQRRQTMHYFNQTLRQSTDRTHIFDEKHILETVENNINRENERSRKSSKVSYMPGRSVPPKPRHRKLEIISDFFLLLFKGKWRIEEGNQSATSRTEQETNQGNVIGRRRRAPERSQRNETHEL